MQGASQLRYIGKRGGESNCSMKARPGMLLTSGLPLAFDFFFWGGG